MVLKSIIGAAMLLTLSAPLYAVPIVHGDLSSDADTNITVKLPLIPFTMYSRFDAFDLTYQETMDAVNGGAFNGWSIATITQAHDFINAALSGSSACTSLTITATPVSCGSITGWNDGDFGASADGIVDTFAYLSDPADLTTIGFANFTTLGGVTDITLAATPGSLDSLNLATGYPVNLLLYSNDPNANPLAQPVPEPGILALLSLGLLGMGVRRFKAKG